MSILDGMPTSMEEFQAANEWAAPMIEKALAKLNITPEAKTIIDLMKDGVPLKSILNISDGERDALFLAACRAFQFGEIAKARDTLVQLYLLDNLDTRVLYVLASTYKAEGNISTAAKFYLHFLALDATNPDGYLRLGECFLAAKEYEQAEETFKIALKQGNENGAPEATLAYARQMIEATKSQRAGKAN